MVDKALKQIRIASVHELFIKFLPNKYLGYEHHSTKQLLIHLYITCVDISVGEPQDNDAAMKQAYNINQQMETLSKQIEATVEYAAAGKTLYTPEQVLITAFQLVFHTGVYADDCKE